MVRVMSHSMAFHFLISNAEFLIFNFHGLPNIQQMQHTAGIGKRFPRLFMVDFNKAESIVMHPDDLLAFDHPRALNRISHIHGKVVANG